LIVLPKTINDICKEAAALMLYPKIAPKLKAQARGCRDRAVRQKLELILLSWRLESVTEACRRLGYSRKFYYKWLTRLKQAGWSLRGLQECSRKPWKSPKKTGPEIEARIHWYARRQYGSRMIEAMLRRSGIKRARSVICHVLNGRRKGKRRRVKSQNPHRKRYELMIPGQRIQLDVKYVPEFVAGKRIYNYVAVDECSRWRFAWGYDALNERCTYDFLGKLKAHCPFPIHTIQTDNGFEFTFSLQGHHTEQSREHRMDEWCRENSIRHRLIPPGAKELNGKVERSHRIDEQYFYWQAPADTLEHFNAKLALWLEFYNRHRLHGGLSYLTPWEKLYERLQALRAPLPASPPEHEPLNELRLKFIDQTPKRILEQQRQQPLKLSLSANPLRRSWNLKPRKAA
jgi:transposase InsO family protein